MRRPAGINHKTNNSASLPYITPIPKPNPIESLKQELLGRFSQRSKETCGCENVSMECFRKKNTCLNEKHTVFAQEHCNTNQPAICIIDDTLEPRNNIAVGCGRYNSNSHLYHPKRGTLYHRPLCHDSSEKIIECKSEKTSNQIFESTQYLPLNGSFLPVEGYRQYQAVSYIQGYEDRNTERVPPENSVQRSPSVSSLSENCDNLDSNRMSGNQKDCAVQVSVRIRPQNPREIIDMCRICTTVTPGEPQIVLGRDKAFTFDCVFDVKSTQHEIYSSCLERLVDGALCGYNATVLAYGQTGSGKTYTMGTGFDRNLSEQQQGIIPRAVSHIFSSIEEIQSRGVDDKINGKIQFNVAAQFLELYNEDIVDLLDPYNKGRVFKIHEDGNGQISVSGATIKPIQGPQEALKCLQQGALARTTASTQMNDQSSRSHALFTILLKRQRIIPGEGSDLCGGDLETLTSKFHFVDLAGSERLKRTGATGERAREGISINCGLLALGNCISALGDRSKKATHIPYRDSKLTRLLQDSLGGNSQTLMISCVSPSDRDFMETLNTLKYANRARNIKNKIQLNQDQSSRTIAQMRREIAALQLELLEYKQGKRLIDSTGNSSITDTFQENAMLLADNKRLQQRVKAMQETINILTGKNSHLILEKETHGWSPSVDTHSSEKDKIAGYLNEIEKLQAKSIELEEFNRQLQVTGTVRNTTRGANRSANFDNPEKLINLAKRDLEKNRELLMSRSLPGFQDDRNKGNSITNANDSSESEDSENESNEKTYQIQADLNEINCDIELKTKLIEELELSQKRMDLMRQHYEDKLNILNTKIVNTQKERDDILVNMGTSHLTQSEPKQSIKKIRDEYENKLKELQREMKKLQQEQRGHIRQRRDIQIQEVKLRTLRNELQELKCIKTLLMRKMADQTSRHKEEETKTMREIAQLRKEQRRQLHAVKSLQAQMHVKDQVLKRKTEEVTSLRRSQRNLLTEKAAGRVQAKGITVHMKERSMRQEWDIMFRTITRASRNKQVIVQLDKELGRLVDEREALGRDLGKIQNRQKLSRNIELDNEEDTIKSNINYIQENIAHVQQAIMAFEESKDSIDNDAQCLPGLIGNIYTVDEAKFLIEQLTDSVITFSCNLALAESRLLEQEALLKEVQHETSIQQQLLQHFLAQNNAVHISDLFDSLTLGISNQTSGSQNSLKSSGTYDIPFEYSMAALCTASQERLKSRSRSPSPTATSDVSQDKGEKIRRRTAQPQELLFGDRELSYSGDLFHNDAATRSFTQKENPTRNYHQLMRVPSIPGSLKQYSNSSSESKKSIEPSMIVPVPQSPHMTHRNIYSKGSPALDNTGVFPPSPPGYPRNISREESSNASSDVFFRLGRGTQDPATGGSIQKVSGKVRIGVPLYCTHTVLGHNSSVLTIKLDGDMLYTASADRTVKIWDLSQETAQHCLSAHPGPVIAVQNDRTTQLLFSASGKFVRVWDLRTSNTKPIKTLSSSGQLLSGKACIDSMIPCNSPITALCLGSCGNLYLGASDKVCIWDVKSFTFVGKLSTGHQSAIMCITSWKGDHSGSTDFVSTGSKDHYVKVFKVPRASSDVCSILKLKPPHYDGVQALAATQNAVGVDAELFSGSRDSGIKRWNIKNRDLKQSLNNAHKGWISGMAFSGDILLSGCRGGIIRLWDVNTCDSLAEMKTDLMINDIVASGQQVFTASSDGKVRVWRFTNALRKYRSLDNS